MNNLFYVFVGFCLCFCCEAYYLDVGRCRPGTLMMNDCNLCKCNINLRYICSDRDCTRVDKFKHFNDAIRPIDVGFEGKGVWRTGPDREQCVPNMPYEKATLLCVCTEDGIWPNPRCHSVFQDLKDIEVVTFESKCLPGKTYQFDCHNCICNIYGKFDTKLCINECEKKEDTPKTIDDGINYEEIYAVCTKGQNYTVDCQNCECIGNNTLLCDKCKQKSNICSTKSKNTIFNIDCNLCFCSENDQFICSTNRCRNKAEKLIANEEQRIGRIIVESDVNSLNCEPDTVYEQSCGKCYCYANGRQKVMSCNKDCKNDDPLFLIKNDCIENHSYFKDCQQCSCEIVGGQKWERCALLENCLRDGLENFNGSCKPSTEFQRGCNVCKCMENGKTISCTDHVCNETKDVVEIETLVVKNHEKCPRGHVYKNGCNYCYCLSNGNAVCTKLNCID